jgi:hypothetical protein
MAPQLFAQRGHCRGSDQNHGVVLFLAVRCWRMLHASTIANHFTQTFTCVALCMCDTFVAISVRAPKLSQRSNDSASDELGKAKIFIIEMVLNVMIGPDGWRNGRP